MRFQNLILLLYTEICKQNLANFKLIYTIACLNVCCDIILGQELNCNCQQWLGYIQNESVEITKSENLILS